MPLNSPLLNPQQEEFWSKLQIIPLISQGLAFKSTKKRDLESIRIQIINPNKSNMIIGCIYRHPNMDLNYFNNDYLNPLLAKLSKEKKNSFLLGDYNVGFSKYEQHSPTNEFVDFLALSVSSIT